MRRLSILAWALFATVAAVPAQVFIVDEQGGSGSHFTDLPAAVAAVPDGATLRVRPGSYSPFAVSGKGLRVVGEGSVSLEKMPGTALDIAATAPDQVVLLRNLAFGSLIGPGPIQVRDARGPVVFEEARLNPAFLAGQPHIVIERSDNVQFHRCVLDTPQHGPQVPRIRATASTVRISYSLVRGIEGTQALVGVSDPGTPALVLDRSRGEAIASILIGGLGGLGCSNLGGCNSLSGPGGTAVSVRRNSTFVAHSSIVAGADGRNEFTTQFGGFVPAADGGDGIQVTVSSARFEGSLPQGGAAGAGTPPGQPGNAHVTTGGTIRGDAFSTPSATQIVGDQVRGQTVNLTVAAAPNSVAAVLLAYRGDLSPIDPITSGSLLTMPALVLGPFAVSGSGRLSLPITLHAAWPLGDVFFGQSFTLEPGGRPWVTNPVAIHVNR